MTDRAQFEAMLEALINDDQQAAKEIFHNIVVGKSREIYEELLESDFGSDQGNPYGKKDDKDEGDSEDESMGDEEDDMDSEEDDMDSEDDGEEADDMDGEEEPEGDIEDRVMDLEDALEDLKAEFEQLLSQEGEEDGDMGDDDMGDMGGEDDLETELGELTAEYPGGSTNFSTGEVKGTHTPEKEVEEEMGDDGETWANSTHGDAGAHTHGIDAVTATGDDMNSKGGSSPLSRAPGSNSLIRHHWHVQEGLVDKLVAMYEEIKGEPMVEDSHQAKTTMKHVNASNASDKTKAAIKKASKDIKPGIKGYKDREDALTAAGVEDDRGPREKVDESVSQMLALNKRLNG